MKNQKKESKHQLIKNNKPPKNLIPKQEQKLIKGGNTQGNNIPEMIVEEEGDI